MPGVVLLAGFEPATFGLEVQRAIHCATGAEVFLIAETGFDPVTFGL